MRKYLLAAVAVTAIASPAAARDNSGYFGVEGGVLFPKDNDADVIVDYTTTQFPDQPAGPAGPADTTFNNTFGIDYKMGYDVDLIGGYDFGMFRLEGEIGYKRAKLDDLEIDSGDIAALNAALNRPSATPDTGFPGLPALVDTDFDLDGRVSVLSAMVNALLEFGNDEASAPMSAEDSAGRGSSSAATPTAPGPADCRRGMALSVRSPRLEVSLFPDRQDRAYRRIRCRRRQSQHDRRRGPWPTGPDRSDDRRTADDELRETL